MSTQRQLLGHAIHPRIFGDSASGAGTLGTLVAHGSRPLRDDVRHRTLGGALVDLDSPPGLSSQHALQHAARSTAVTSVMSARASSIGAEHDMPLQGRAANVPFGDDGLADH